MKKVVMIIAEVGFRDEELRHPQDILEKNGIEVKIASTTTDYVKGMLGMKVRPDVIFKYLNPDDYDAIIFVGGGGATQYWDDPIAHKLAQEALSKNRIVAAICIAPVILARAGILKGKKATVFHTEADRSADSSAQVGMPTRRGNL